jgi:hypothetical protein
MGFMKDVAVNIGKGGLIEGICYLASAPTKIFSPITKRLCSGIFKTTIDRTPKILSNIKNIFEKEYESSKNIQLQDKNYFMCLRTRNKTNKIPKSRPDIQSKRHLTSFDRVEKNTKLINYLYSKRKLHFRKFNNLHQ